MFSAVKYLLGTRRSESTDDNNEPDCCRAEKRLRVLVVDRLESIMKKTSLLLRKQTLVCQMMLLVPQNHHGHSVAETRGITHQSLLE